MGADSYSAPTPVAPKVYPNPTATMTTELMTPSSDHQAANSSSIDATINVLEARIRQLESQVEQAAAVDTPAPSKKNTLTGEIKLAVSCNIVSLSNINTADESFQAEIMLRAYTLNAKGLQVVIRGVGNYADRADRSGVCEKITVDNWEPRLSFNNLTETTTWKMSVKAEKDGELSFKYHIAGIFKEKLELQNFPFDIQPLSFVMSSSIPAVENGFVTKDEQGNDKICGIRLVSEDGRTDRKSILKTSNFCAASFKPKLWDGSNYVRYEEDTTSPEDSSTGTLRSLLRASILVERKPMFFIWNIVVPMLVINGISLGSFAVPKSDTADRLSVSMTMVLTMVAFKLQISDILPDLSYLTLLDCFVLGSFLFVSFIAVENIISSDEISNMSVEVDTQIAWVFVIVYTAGTLITILEMLRRMLWMQGDRIGLRSGTIVPADQCNLQSPVKTKSISCKDEADQNGVKSHSP